ncbi:FecCD family ABC transporter permease [Croceimicrobium hydrocarbonivorans]|uniref:Iron ABC transporter permease n=1 Tax=Croceimicrobium hydrocarbonivorans TaxID=2761580 RepID=A0A7H0VIF4_9FLAO|nr:iron ABC transporter permease [Croceimicrobium hydrocarbonivorans]QNR25502.1 iron ABC transporter permease [Croceimicrobium hydrocarbonivorans]
MKPRLILIILTLLLPLSALLSLRYGAVAITWSEIFNALNPGSESSLHENIFINLRLPRIFLGILCGSALSVGGVLLQALFRNPIVEPGLIGTSSGAAFGAALYFVMGNSLPALFGSASLAVISILGSLLATAILLAFDRQGRGAEIQILLAGVAINALFMSGVGFMSYLARDPQARSINFWNLGTLSGATWTNVSFIAAIIIPTLILSLRTDRALNALSLGISEAAHLGIKVRRFRWMIISAQIALVAMVTSIAGIIPFVGLIVPHILRLLGGGEHRYLLRGSLLLGPSMVLLTDLMARTLLMPAEIPLGILTSFIGAPLFLLLLRKSIRSIQL